MRVFYVHLPFRNGQFANIAVHFLLLSSKCRQRLTSRNSRAKNRIPGRSTHRVPGRKEDLSHMDAAQRAVRRRDFLAGVRDGVPIGLGYLAVAFSLGIAARSAGLNAFQGFLISLLNNASAGEYAAFTVIAADSGFVEMALITLITNARYLLMSCSLSQKFSPDTPLYHRLLVGYDVTDELFGIAIARPGYLDPFYSYGAFVPAIPGWAIGTALGVTAGSLLPARVVSALSVALFGMFLAIIIPPSKKNPVVLGCVCVSFAASWLCSVLPLTSGLSEGTRTILLTILIASAAAALFPVKDEPEEKEAAGHEH